MINEVFTEPHKLLEKVRHILTDKNNTIYFSTINLWEIAIKTSLGREEFVFDVKQLKQNLLVEDFKELIISEHTSHIVELPYHHRDPFDRMLIAQAIAEGLCLITQDSKIKLYEEVEILS